jgi:hypothetical protein
MFTAGGVSDHNKNKGIIYFVSYSSLDNGWSAECLWVRLYYSMESKTFYVTSHIFNVQSSGKLYVTSLVLLITSKPLNKGMVVTLT